MKKAFNRLFSGSGMKYVISSVGAFLIDNILYNILFSCLGAEKTIIAQLISRVVSSAFQCNLNYFWVFGEKGAYTKSVLKYYCLCIPQTFVSMVLLTALISRLTVSNPLIATGIKIIIEAVLFVASYFIQKYWVFKNK